MVSYRDKPAQHIGKVLLIKVGELNLEICGHHMSALYYCTLYSIVLGLVVSILFYCICVTVFIVMAVLSAMSVLPGKAVLSSTAVLTCKAADLLVRLFWISNFFITLFFINK